jgi:hypothetical protein
MDTRYKTRKFLQEQLEKCNDSLKMYIFLSLALGFALGKLSTIT